MSRREFLKLLLATLTSIPLSACADAFDLQPPLQPTDIPPAADPSVAPQNAAPDTPLMLPTASASSNSAPWDVIVVGAGVAGLCAAQTLQQKGRRVLILEARDRIGGRIWTDNSAGIPLDLGASWIHGVRGNPIAAVADQQGATLVFTDYDDMQRFDAAGEKLSGDLDRRVEMLLDRYIERAREYAESQNHDLSLQSALDAVLRAYPLDIHDMRLINYAVNTAVEHEYAADSDQLSAWYFDTQKEFDGNDAIFKRGYRTIVDFLAQNLDIRLNHVVQRIVSSNSRVALIAAQGVWHAQTALITVPPGVLQRDGITFEPPLPAARQQALGRIGMGVLNKCCLIFPEVFWDDATLLGYVGERKGEWAEWLNVNALLGAPVLIGFNAGAYARTLETQSDAQIVAAAMHTLRRMYGNTIPNPSDYRITRWAADPFAFGAYSFLAVGATPEDYDTLAQPVDNRLFFAGEHTQRDYPATVHGAYLSGKRAANEILRLLK